MEFDKRIQNLENVVSYGTLGILNTLVKTASDPDGIKRNVFLINMATVVRNCYDKSSNRNHILNNVSVDIQHLKQYINQYNPNQHVIIIIYYHPSLRKAIPDDARKADTPSRLSQDELLDYIARTEHFSGNRLGEIQPKSGNADEYCLYVSSGYAYRQLYNILRTGLPLRSMQRVWMLTHSPVDFFIAEKMPAIEVLESHTGRTFDRNGFSKKVFKDPSIPFNRVTLKLFGDKDLIKAQIRKTKKTREILAKVNLRTKTEKEILSIAKTKLGVNPKSLKWDL